MDLNGTGNPYTIHNKVVISFHVSFCPSLRAHNQQVNLKKGYLRAVVAAAFDGPVQWRDGLSSHLSCGIFLREQNFSSLGCSLHNLNPKSMLNNSPKPRIIAIKAIVLPTFGV